MLDIARLHGATYEELNAITRLDTTKGHSWMTIVDDVREAVMKANSEGKFDDGDRDGTYHLIAKTLVPRRPTDRGSEFGQIAAAWHVDLSEFDGVAHEFGQNDKGEDDGLADLGDLKNRTAHVMCGRALYLAYYAAARNLVAWIDTETA
ncbi:hypothetical protein SAMN05421837_107309 [Amycolatopsis pretoriensis]|uniref:Uncharacterized protein n=1 Tax=Amycolatopsis pretoriensis TaxID=218821 RepID=A0A1H5R7B5_9PSEU|nr:hypothetical protein [Amycolatopsis pretoriensis]SEF34296.1 hypothetical protein SAMN05421837_107309 [Amycolatopsis pretoriensis]